MHLHIKTLTLFVLAALQTRAAILTERQAMLSGLERRFEIRILHLESRIDSLDVETVRAQWLPQTEASTGLHLAPYDSAARVVSGTFTTLYESGSKTTTLTTGDSLSVTQHLPGGGTINGNAAFGNEWYLTADDSTRLDRSLSLSIRQPLLRGAWRHSPVSHSVKIARLDNRTFSLEQRKRLLSYCSDVRTRFWKCYETQALVKLYRKEARYAEEELNVVRTRHTLGIATPLDTLTAKLAWINAVSRLHDAESDEMQTREELAFHCGLAPHAVKIDTSLAVSLTRLPPPNRMLQEAERFDPQLRIFDVAAERLELTRAHTRNSLLPDVGLTASLRRSRSETTEEEYYRSNSVIGLIASYAFPVKSRKISLEKTDVSLKINRLEREQYKRELLLRVQELHRSWEREFRSIEIARSARQIAQQTLDATRKGYSVGTVDRLSLDKAENDYRIAVIDLLEKEILMKQLEIVFDELTGATLTRLGVSLE